MRIELLYRPLLLLERIGQWASNKRRLNKLRQTIACKLDLVHIDSLELIELCSSITDLNVIYDIGANVGTWTILAKSICENAEVHAFEPLPQHFTKFLNLTDRLKGVKLHQIALGSERASSEMHITNFSDASSLLVTTDRARYQWHISEVGVINVVVETLDEYRSFNELPMPDLIKMDIQGFELEALKGAKHTLQRTKALILEVGFAEFYADQCRFDEVATFLANHHFRLTALGFGTSLGKPLVQSDLLFLREGIS